jgi:hypothetical protein
MHRCCLAPPLLSGGRSALFHVRLYVWRASLVAAFKASGISPHWAFSTCVRGMLQVQYCFTAEGQPDSRNPSSLSGLDADIYYRCVCQSACCWGATTPYMPGQIWYTVDISASVQRSANCWAAGC